MAEHEPDLREELETCLEVLAEWVDLTPVYDDGTIPESDVELVAAASQVIELVQLLLADNDAAWSSVGLLRQVNAELQRRLQERERIWTPGQGGSSGQQRSRRASRRQSPSL